MKRILMLAIVCSLLLTGQAQKQVYGRDDVHRHQCGEQHTAYYCRSHGDTLVAAFTGGKGKWYQSQYGRCTRH